MPGPNIQSPGPATPMFDIIRDDEGKLQELRLTPEWSAFFALVGQAMFSASRSGSTSSRPTSDMLRWVGMPYFDQQIGKQVFLKHATSSVWVESDGTVA